MIGPYEPLQPLGQGGMGTVWLARHARLGFEVALKLLPNAAQHRFDSEVAALAGLHHPHIVQIHDCGRLEKSWQGALAGTPWLAMERCEATVADRVPADAAGLRQLVLDLLDALGESHGHGILHLDLKPSNLLWRGHDVVLADFGLATSDGQLPGSWLTPGSCAPEHQAGDRDRLGPWSDLYALALTLERISADLGGLRSWVARATADRLQDRFPSAAIARAALLGEAQPRSAPLPVLPTRPSGGKAAPASPPPAPEAVEPLPDLELPRARPVHRGAGVGLWGRGSPPLVGRSAALAELWPLLARAPVQACVSGPAGIGKSRLADAFAVAAHRLGGFTRVRLDPVPGEPVDLVAAALRVPGARFAPGLAGAWVQGQLPPSLGIRGFTTWLASRAPVVLQVDEPTRLSEELRSALGELSGRVVVVYSAREPVPAEVQVRLQPLSDAASRQLLGGVLGLDNPTALRLSRHAEGNPGVALLAMQAALQGARLERGIAGLRLLGEPERPDTEGVWRDRIAAAPADHRAALEGVAVQGHRFAHGQLDAAAQLWAVQAGLLQAERDDVCWTHPGARQAVLDQAPSLSELHRRAAASAAHPGSRGLHLLAAGDADAAADPLWEGFRLALSEQDLPLAQRCDTALERLPRPLDRLRHWIARSKLLWAQNHDPDARQALEAARPLLGNGGPVEHAEFLLNEGNLLANRFELEAAIACYRQVDATLTAHGEAYVAHGLARCLGWSGREEEALAVLEPVLQGAIPSRRDDLLLVKATTLHTLKRLPEAVLIYEQLLSSRPVLAYQAASNLADLQRQEGQLEAARSNYARAFDLADAAGAEPSFATVCAPMTEALADPQGTYARLSVAIHSATSPPVQGFGHLGCLHCCATPELWAQHWAAAFALIPELPTDPDSIWFLEGARDHARRRGWSPEAEQASAHLATLTA